MGDGELGGQGIESAVDVEASVVKAINPKLDWAWVVRDGWVMTLGGDSEYRRA